MPTKPAPERSLVELKDHPVVHVQSIRSTGPDERGLWERVKDMVLGNVYEAPEVVYPGASTYADVYLRGIRPNGLSKLNLIRVHHRGREYDLFGVLPHADQPDADGWYRCFIDTFDVRTT